MSAALNKCENVCLSRVHTTKRKRRRLSSCLLFSRHENQHTSEENGHFRNLPRHGHLRQICRWKGEGHSIYILKTPSHKVLPERSTNVVFAQNPLTALSRAIPSITASTTIIDENGNSKAASSGSC